MNAAVYPAGAVIMAPLAGYTDLPYRQALRRCGCVYAFTEMVDAASLAYRNAGGVKLLARGADERWLGVQLVGSNLEHLKAAVDRINECEFEVLDFNLGCPVPKVAKKCAGAALGREWERATGCFELLAARSRFPLTAKIRILDEADPEPTLQLVRALAAVGARAITVHGRVMKAFYSGPVYTGIIRACCELGVCQIVANGGVTDGATAAALRADTHCDAIMVARGAMGNPWLFRELAGGGPPDFSEWRELVHAHIAAMRDFYGESAGLKIARKVLMDYLKGRGFGGAAKNTASRVETMAQFEEFMRELRPRCGHWQ